MATSVVNMEASEPPTTAETYEDFQSEKGEEEYEKHFEKVSILGIQGLRFTETHQETQKGVQNISQMIQQGVTQLKGKSKEPEGARSSVQAPRPLFPHPAPSLGLHFPSQNTTSRLAALENILQQEYDKLLKVIKLTETQLETIEQNSRALNCEIIEMKSNGSNSGCCPRGWLTFRSSCYWATQSRDTWQGAKKACDEKKSHLVIINSADEKAFVKNSRRGSDTWIGLTDQSGSWTWVDGSAYVVDPKDWATGQPDHWYGHGLGGGEDCAHLREGGLWNDNHCSRSFTWVCEMELGI